MALPSCSPEAFTSLSLPAFNIRALLASPVTNYPIDDVGQFPNHGQFPSGNIDFCNVTVVYSHRDEEDYMISFEAWLPDHDSWNERILASGGSGFAAGRIPDVARLMSGWVNEGYASFTTDGGASNVTNLQFALDDSGSFDQVAMENWGTVALGDMAVIGKTVVEEFYGQPAAYSYFSGCSQGGRHGYDFAQKYPDAFDGIAASAPAIGMIDSFYFLFWPHLLMNQAESWPRGCEMDSLTALAIEECDAKDGVKDGVIANPALCADFDPSDYVGAAALACEDSTSIIGEMAAKIVKAAWTGLPDDSGRIIHPGLFPGSDLTGNSSGIGMATTTCYDADEGCAGFPLELGYAPARIFGTEDADFDYTQLTFRQFWDGLEKAKELVGESWQTLNPDLSAFRKRGGKLITFHGLADQLLSAGIVRKYYDEVADRFSDVDDFYRYFEIPGLGHCLGPQHPDSTFNVLKLWVEEGIAPGVLEFQQPDSEGSLGERIACPYPQRAKYKSCCGDPNSAKCYECKHDRIR